MLTIVHSCFFNNTAKECGLRCKKREDCLQNNWISDVRKEFVQSQNDEVLDDGGFVRCIEGENYSFSKNGDAGVMSWQRVFSLDCIIEPLPSFSMGWKELLVLIVLIDWNKPSLQQREMKRCKEVAHIVLHMFIIIIVGISYWMMVSGKLLGVVVAVVAVALVVPFQWIAFPQ